MVRWREGIEELEAKETLTRGERKGRNNMGVRQLRVGRISN